MEQQGVDEGEKERQRKNDQRAEPRANSNADFSSLCKPAPVRSRRVPVESSGLRRPPNAFFDEARATIGRFNVLTSFFSRANSITALRRVHSPTNGERERERERDSVCTIIELARGRDCERRDLPETAFRAAV